MGIYQTLPDEIKEVDVIVAGGGTAGCIIASRLASADPNLSILIIEGGPDNYHDPSILHMGLFFGHLAPGSKNTIFYQAKPSDHIDGRAPVVPAGSVLGGSSSINMGAYNRPARSDYDSWNVPGWTFDELLPFIKKIETFHAKGDAELHGYNGPIHISAGTHRLHTSEDDFVVAANKVGYPEVDDLADMKVVNAVTRGRRYIHPDTGYRQDTAHQYLHPLLRDEKHPNLHVVVESQVARVVVEDGRAVGVVFRRNPQFHPEESKMERTVRARKQVVVSCGTLGTPLVLERSGIGRPEVLSKAGVPLVAENQGVGVGYEDHQNMIYPFKTNLEHGSTINGIVFGTMDPVELIKTKNPVLGTNAQDIGAKFRPTEEEAAALGPDFLAAYQEHYKNKPDKAMIGMSLVNSIAGAPPPGVPYGEYLSVVCFSLYPFSRGHMHITGPSIDDPHDFESGYLSDPKGLDVKKHIWGYKTLREISRRMKCYRGELPEWAPNFATNSPAALANLTEPLPEDVPNLEYSAEDDAVLEAHIRNTAATTWHGLGTCKMGKREDGAAVDAALNVYGVQGLKLADLSIAPQNVGANTYNTALTIGEKAADILLRELGLAQ